MTAQRTATLRCVLTIMVALALYGCATTKRDWQEANRQGTVETYELFLQNHPNAEQANDARRLLPDLNSEKEEKTMTIDRKKAIENWERLSDEEKARLQVEEARLHQEGGDGRCRLHLRLEIERLRQHLRSVRDGAARETIVDELARLETRAREIHQEDIKRTFIAPQYHQHKATNIERLWYRDTAYLGLQKVIQASQANQCSRSMQLQYITASEFKKYEYISVPYSTQWGPNHAGSKWYSIPFHDSDPYRVDGTQYFKFNVYASCSSPPFSIWDKQSFVESFGMLKFILPAQACDVTVEWSVAPVIDLIMGAEIWGDSGGLFIDFAVLQQPGSTDFPNTDPETTFELIPTDPRILYQVESGSNFTRVTQKKLLTGSYQVKAGISSSVLVGLRLVAHVEDGEAHINPYSDHVLDGVLKFADPKSCGDPLEGIEGTWGYLPELAMSFMTF